MTKIKRFEDMITQNIDQAYRFAYTYVRNREDAEDVVSLSVEKALRHIGTLKNEDYMKTWFFKIVIRTATDLYRKKEKVIPLDDCSEAVAQGSEAWEPQTSFEDIIHALSVIDRMIVTLRFMEELKFSEIAEMLDMNENTVKTHFYGAIKKLRITITEEM